MSFADSAVRLCGQCALVFGWQPTQFWDSTPAELQCVLAAHLPNEEAPPDAASLRKLMAQFPDIPTGDD